jgi:hypothetical protein
MRRLLYVAAAVVVLLVASQLLVPAYLEHRAEKRLTEKGGHADVSIDALPAIRLLFNDGSKIRVRGDGLHVDLLKQSGPVFDELDRFQAADVRLTRMSAGPFAVRQVTLARSNADDPYSLVISASVTGRALSSYAGDQLAGGFGSAVGRLAAGLVPFSAERIPLEVDADVRSLHGRPKIEHVEGSILGVSAGPLAGEIASAIADRL